ncbi:MAG: preprotein translocase subunit YajC [Planctomycetota bacterium]|jgi:preprotein translocase subunit YajC|nr:preprotein translocase subunit YajC [Planctomycetota bacterium]
MHRIIVLLVAASVAFAEANAGGTGGPAAPAGGGSAPSPGATPGATPGTDPADAASSGGSQWIFLAFFVLMGFMLFSTFRSQKKEKAKLANMIETLKLGDKVETIGGLRGEIVRKGEAEFDIKTGGESVLTVAAGAVKTVVSDEAKKE